MCKRFRKIQILEFCKTQNWCDESPPRECQKYISDMISHYTHISNEVWWWYSKPSKILIQVIHMPWIFQIRWKESELSSGHQLESTLLGRGFDELNAAAWDWLFWSYSILHSISKAVSSDGQMTGWRDMVYVKTGWWEERQSCPLTIWPLGYVDVILNSFQGYISLTFWVKFPPSEYHKPSLMISD